MKIKNVLTDSVCKICSGKAGLYGVVDFNTSCNSKLPDHAVYPLSGIPIYYHRCNDCGLIYTHSFDDWDYNDFKEYIYNDEYIIHDPDFAGIRAEKNVNLIMENFNSIKKWNVLDYGGGDGQLARLLQERGVNAFGWDPFHLNLNKPSQKFELITSFEVFEHTPTPVETFLETYSFLVDKGAIFFSTLVSDSSCHQGTSHWYIAPRNGHVTIYTKKSLSILFSRIGMDVISFSDSLHIGYYPM